MTTKFFRQLMVVSMAILVLYGCNKKKDKNEVIIHELSDTDMLNPYTYQSADAGYITGQMFFSLLGLDPATLKYVPSLAKALPVEEVDKEHNTVSYTYEIRPEAKWDNGQDITAKDVEFTLKVIKCPKVNDEREKPYYELIHDIKMYPDNPKKFTLVCNKVYILAYSTCGGFPILPAYVYDPKNLLVPYSLIQLNDSANTLENDPKINEFANDFNGEKYQREKGFVVGCGPYEFSEWVTGQKVVLTRKKNWWGDPLEKENFSFQAYPDKLIYQTINDQTAALTALKGEKLDVMYGIKPKDFVEMPKSEKIQEHFNLSTPLSMSYTYFGINMHNPKFADKRVRQALAHLVDVEKLIHVIGYDLGQRVNGPIHPSKKGAYNDTIAPYDFNIEKAKKLLADAGWKDSNGNGTIDKVIDGQLTEFNITFTYNAGNDSRRDAALIFKEDARKAGINVDVVPQEWSIYIDNQSKHNFEMFYGAWIGSPNPEDPKQIWSTESQNNGSNYVFFGNAETDKLIEDIRSELNEDKRNDLYRQLQVIIHDEVPYIFIWAPKERIAINKKFTNAETFVVRPGFNEAAFKLAD